MKELNVDPELESFLPPLTYEENEALKANLLKHGCIEPIEVSNGTIIDGHNRYRLCKELGIDFSTREVKFASRNETLEYMYQKQIARRNLNNFQLATMILKWKEIVAAEAKTWQKLGVKRDLPPNWAEGSKTERETREILAKKVGLGHNTIDRVDYIQKHATPQELQDAAYNRISVNRLYTKLRQEDDPTYGTKATPEDVPDLEAERESIRKLNGVILENMSKDKRITEMMLRVLAIEADSIINMHGEERIRALQSVIFSMQHLEKVVADIKKAIPNDGLKMIEA